MLAEKTKSVIIEWKPNAFQKIGDAKGYNFYYGTTSGDYHTKIDVGDTLNFQVLNFADSVYYVAATAYDSVGNESEFSNEVIVDFENPNHPKVQYLNLASPGCKHRPLCPCRIP